MSQAITILSGNRDLAVLFLVFAGVALLTVGLGLVVASWVNIRRRLSDATIRSHAKVLEPELIKWRAEPEFLKGFVPADESRKSELTKLLHSAGYYGNGAVAWFQGIRVLSAIAFGILTAVLFGLVFPGHSLVMAALASTVMTFFGYILPRSLLSIHRDRLLEQYRLGFPDFLDLQIVCIGAGASLEGAVQRASSDASYAYPDLARYLGFMMLELRAGKSTREALDNLAERLGIPEARSYATVVQQAEEFGTSLSASLRVYSADMRHQRLARAEEKAHALKVKLVLPMTIFIFPVVLGVTLMPVVFKLRSVMGE